MWDVENPYDFLINLCHFGTVGDAEGAHSEQAQLFILMDSHGLCLIFW